MKASSWERVEALRRVEPTGPRILLGSEEYVESKQVALSLALGFLVGGCLGWVAGMLGAFALGYLDPGAARCHQERSGRLRARAPQAMGAYVSEGAVMTYKANKEEQTQWERQSEV
ncbi:MAG: hypothetical protein ACE5HB_05275 [Terriglobia bacterium]